VLEFGFCRGKIKVPLAGGKFSVYLTRKLRKRVVSFSGKKTVVKTVVRVVSKKLEVNSGVWALKQTKKTYYHQTLSKKLFERGEGDWYNEQDIFPLNNFKRTPCGEQSTTICSSKAAR
jgi:hypothetical protein